MLRSMQKMNFQPYARQPRLARPCAHKPSHSSPETPPRFGGGPPPTAPNTNPAQQQQHPRTQDRCDLVRRLYFDRLFTHGDYPLADQILDKDVIHNDMVRDEQFVGYRQWLSL